MSKEAKRLKSIMANFRKWSETYNPYMDFITDNDKPDCWYIRIRDLDDAFKGGQYIVQLRAPAEYPFKPPEFYFFTQQGVYLINTKVCISIGEFHADQYAAANGGMGGFARELVNGLICWKDLGNGFALVNANYYSATTEVQRQRILPSINANIKHLAQESLKWNLEKYPQLVRRFDDLPFSKALVKLPTLNLSDNAKIKVEKFLKG